ncbi:MAG: glycosyltransferase family 1 protein, partial [Anaerolineae bacterium]
AINNQQPTASHQLPQIITPGFIDDDDKAALLSGATALLYPSLYEGFGFPVLEAQACGAPVLCANTSSLPEVAGEAALLVNPEDTAAITAGIKRLVSDPLLRLELTQAGLENVRRFTWKETAVQALNALEKAAG